MQKATIRIPPELFEMRKQRMRKLIELNAPPTIIRVEAEILLSSFKRRTLKEWLWKNTPLLDWWGWLTSAKYRARMRAIDLMIDRIFDDGAKEQPNGDGVQAGAATAEPGTPTPQAEGEEGSHGGAG